MNKTLLYSLASGVHISACLVFAIDGILSPSSLGVFFTAFNGAAAVVCLWLALDSEVY